MKCFKPYDVFISHAVEDQEEVANELTRLLDARSLKVWYSKERLRIGESLKEQIYAGLKQSRYGVVILSKNFMQSEWAKEELKQLLAYDNILPIKHGLTSAEISIQLNMQLGDTWALATNEGLEVISFKIHDQIRHKDIICIITSWLSWLFHKYPNHLKNIAFVLVLICFSAITGVYFNSDPAPPDWDSTHIVLPYAKRCTAFTQKGERCKKSTKNASGKCFIHEK